jgi:hypothetical protein
MRQTTATHTVIIPTGALLTEPGKRQTIWHKEEGRFVVILDGRTFYVAASEVSGVVPVD